MSRVFIFVFIVSVIICNSCTSERHSKEWEILEDVESFIVERPDSALDILNDIEVEQLRGEKELARYSLLMSMALDKNYIDTTDFNILQPAIDYYQRMGTPDEKLKTYYYQGRVYQNMGYPELAMNSFVKALDFKNLVSDSLALSHLLTSLGTIYVDEYKASEYTQVNLEAAHIYEKLNYPYYAFNSLLNALEGAILMDNPKMADSLLRECGTYKKQIFNENYEPLRINYAVTYAGEEELKRILAEYDTIDAENYKTQIVVAQGYIRLNYNSKALKILNRIPVMENDSARFLIVKAQVLEGLGNYREAFDAFKEFYSLMDYEHHRMFKNGILFIEERHNLELEKVKAMAKKDNIILITLCCAIVLFWIMSLVFYSLKLSQAKRRQVQSENEQLLNKQRTLQIEKELIETSKRNKELEIEHQNLALQNLELEKLQLEKEKELIEMSKRNKELEIEYQKFALYNLNLEKMQLEKEKEDLEELLAKQKELPQPVQQTIRERLGMLNALLAKEITKNSLYAEPYKKWIETIRKERTEFMNSTRLAFSVSHPKLISFFQEHNLTQDEINYLCLYAIGLRGKEVGEYLQLKGHYNISSAIRKKLSIDEHETNLVLYIRKLMSQY